MEDLRKKDFEETCQLFIGALHKYFNRVRLYSNLIREESETGVPYMKDKDSLVLKQFTGVIGISGNRKGFVYISADEKLYKDLLYYLVKREDPSEAHIMDMAGEISNVVSGNVRETYGKDFMITVPMVFKGKPEELQFPEDVPVFVIPFNWNNHSADLVVALE